MSDHKFNGVTYKFHSKKGERLAIFYDGKIHIYRCSLDDQFNKKFIRENFGKKVELDSEPKTFWEHLKTAFGWKKKTTLHPEIIDLPGLSRQGFLEWCRKRYYLREEREQKAKYTYLKRGTEIRNIKVKPLRKMDGV